MSKTKTISAHIDTTYNLEHNNRDIVPDNVDIFRFSDNYNYYKVASGHRNDNGTYYATIDEIYGKLFEPEWREFQARQRPSRRFEGSYLEYIRDKKHKARSVTTDKRYKDHAKNEAYEIIFQIGNKDDTDWYSNIEDFEKARLLLKNLCDYIVDLPFAVVITDKELNNPNWQPPVENGIAILNLALHCDEMSPPGIHCTIIPFCKSERGSKRQALLKQTFANLGYPTRFDIKKDEDGNPIPKYDKTGNVKSDSEGNPIYKKKAVQKGVIDWMAEIKDRLAYQMKQMYDWDRTDILDGRKHLDIKDYKIYAKNEELKKLDRQCEILRFLSVDIQSDIVTSYVEDYNFERYRDLDKSQLWDIYRDQSRHFWNWYRQAKNEIEFDLNKTREERKIKANDYFYNLFINSSKLLAIIAYVCSKIFYYYKNQKYKTEIKKLSERQKELKALSKRASSDFYNKREVIKSVEDAADIIKAIEYLENEMESDYANSPEYELSYDVLNE